MSIRGSKKPGSSRGSILLITLCFVTVLGIMLAGYIAVCNRAMSLSNRGVQADLSRQLAEAGIEEALRAFNKNDWSSWSNSGTSVTWNTSTYAASKRAVATIAFPAGKFAQGSTATVKVRVDNYDVRVLGATWSSSKNYRLNDLVGYNGIWYRCLQSNSNTAPLSGISSYWAPEGAASTWSSTISYGVEDMVFYSGYWYRCAVANTNSVPPNANWVRVNFVNVDSTSGVGGVQDAVVNWYGTWYRWNGSWDNAPPISWRWRNVGMVYKYNDKVCYSNVWYRYYSVTPTDTTTSYSSPASDTSRWEKVTTMWDWSSGSIKYNMGDAVYYGSTGLWYRCLQAHTSSGSTPPTNATYWTNTPQLSMAWTAGPYFSANDVVTYNGVWYRCIFSHTSSTSILPTNTSYWIGANTSSSSYKWSAATAYSVNNYRCYGGVWYKCLVANTGKSPNDTTYWTNSWSQSTGVTTGAPVVYAEATVTLSGAPSARAQLRAPISPVPLFSNAAAGATTLTITGGTGTVDSYDSVTDPNAATRGYSAVLAAGNTSGTAMTVGNGTTVKGYVAANSSTTTPFAPLISYGSSATVQGSTPAGVNVDTNQVSRSPYIPQLDPLPLPSLLSAFSSASFPKGQQIPTPNAADLTLNLGTAGATTPSIYYMASQLQLRSSNSSYYKIVNINGPVILYIQGDLRPSTSGATININSSGSAEIHIRDELRVESASNGIINYTKDPKKLLLISDRSSTSTQYYRDAVNDFYGVIYMPNTATTLGLSITTGVEIFGALSANEITFNNEANLHYDTSLRYATFLGVDQPYTASDWRKLPANETATMP